MSIVKRFAKNQNGRDLIVGDIHGHFTKLNQALAGIGFNPECDRLFSVGDLVDRGAESHLALEWLEKPWFHAVAGNHESMAIHWPSGELDEQSYVANGGGWNVSNAPDEQRRIADAFLALPIAIELETELGLVGIVHAECPFRSWIEFTAALEDKTGSNSKLQDIIIKAQWSRNRVKSGFDDDVEGVRAVVVGHTPVRQFTSLGNVLYIDTGAWLPLDRAGEFTILDAATLMPAEVR